MINEIKSFEERKNELVKIGKEKGFVTYEELASSLKGLDLDSDALDELYNVFNSFIPLGKKGALFSVAHNDKIIWSNE